MDKFPREFAATVYAYAPSFHNTVEFWEDMRNAGLFKYWDPQKGPYRFYNKAANQELPMLRIYKVDCDLKPHILPNVGYKNAPRWIGGLVYCQVTPVLKEQEMEAQLNKFNEILKNNDNPPAQLSINE